MKFNLIKWKYELNTEINIINNYNNYYKNNWR